MAKLLIIRGDKQGNRINLDVDKLVIGRNPECGLVVSASAVSREHAQILRINNQFFVKDLKSRNKTYVNSQEVNPEILVRLHDGDRIKICDFLCMFSEVYEVVARDVDDQHEQRWPVPADSAPVTLGRGVENDWVVPWDDLISRHHATLAFAQDRLIVQKSPTASNPILFGDAEREEFELAPGERFVIGKTTFLLCVEGPPADPESEPREVQESLQVLVDAESPKSEPALAQLRDVLRRAYIQHRPGPETSAAHPPEAGTLLEWMPLDEAYSRLRKQLETNHVLAFCPPTLYQSMESSLRSTGGAVQLLHKGFHHFAVVWPHAGIDASGTFQLERFFDHMVNELVKVFRLAELGHAFRVEDLAQILKDEPPSLFVFMGVQYVPPNQLPRLRNFTQELHRVLMIAEARPSVTAETLGSTVLEALREAVPRISSCAIVTDQQNCPMAFVSRYGTNDATKLWHDQSEERVSEQLLDGSGLQFGALEAAFVQDRVTEAERSLLHQFCVMAGPALADCINYPPDGPKPN